MPILRSFDLHLATLEKQIECALELRRLVHNSDAKFLRDFIGDVSSYCYKDSPRDDFLFSPVFFEEIQDLFKDSRFLKSEAADSVLRMFETDWGRLSEQQKEVLLVNICDAYATFTEKMACFVLSEIIGEYYCNEAAFKVLSHLVSTSPEMPRLFIPHGLEHIIKDCPDVEIVDQARFKLAKLLADPSLAVREEVQEALKNISRQSGNQRASN